MTSLDQLNNWIQEYGGTIVVLTLVIVIITVAVKSWPAISKFVHTIDIVIDLPAWQDSADKKFDALGVRFDDVEETISSIKGRFDDVDTNVKRINHQVHPNGGSSLNDKVEKAQEGVDQIRNHLGLTYK